MKYIKNEIKESYTYAILKPPLPKNLFLKKINQRNFEDISSKNTIFLENIIKLTKSEPSEPRYQKISYI